MNVLTGATSATLAVLVLVTAASSPAQQGADVGAQAFATCRTCHALGAGQPSGIGPNLHGLFGRQAGSQAGYHYSAALEASKLRWDDRTLDAYLAAPSKLVPGTRMVTHVDDPARRAALIGYLKVETAK